MRIRDGKNRDKHPGSATLVSCLLADPSLVESATFEVAVSGMNRRRSQSDHSEKSGNFGHSFVACSIRPEPE